MNGVRGSRIPRAPNLMSAKLILKQIAEHRLLSLDVFRLIGRNILGSQYAPYAGEYLKLFALLGFIKKIRETIVVSEENRLIISGFSNERELTDYDVKVFKDRLVESNSVRWFLREIFDYEVKEHKWLDGPHALKLKDMAEEYMKLTNLSEATSRREAKLIKDWLGQVGIIEQSYYKRYYLTFGTISFEKFEKTFEETYKKLTKSNESGIRWLGIAPIRALICEGFGIGRREFDDHFRRLVVSRRGALSTSPGSAAIEEVRKFGVVIDNRLVYYVKFEG
jgi:hypothetical protein